MYMDMLWVYLHDMRLHDYTPENNQHLKVLIWGGGRGGLIISTLGTDGKMLTIVIP